MYILVVRTSSAVHYIVFLILTIISTWDACSHVFRTSHLCTSVTKSCFVFTLDCPPSSSERGAGDKKLSKIWVQEMNLRCPKPLSVVDERERQLQRRRERVCRCSEQPRKDWESEELYRDCASFCESFLLRRLLIFIICHKKASRMSH